MSVDSVAFPLPVVVKGYACLTKAEMELANKNIDPARPQDGPGGRDRHAPAPQPTDNPPAEDTAQEMDGRILSYTPESVRTVSAEKASTYSVKV